jgi:D-galactose 1-dehydrogenase
VFVESAHLKFPANRQTPVDVELRFKSSEPHQPTMSAGFNWLEESGEIWTIRVVTGRGDELKLENGGRKLLVNNALVIENPDNEYEQIYAHFAKLLKKGKSDVTDEPLRLVADAFLLGARENVAEFYW